jgi:hypothetical protein
VKAWSSYHPPLLLGHGCSIDCLLVLKEDVACTAEDVTTVLSQNCSALLIPCICNKNKISNTRRKLEASRKPLITQGGRSGGTQFQQHQTVREYGDKFETS